MFSAPKTTGVPLTLFGVPSASAPAAGRRARGRRRVGACARGGRRRRRIAVAAASGGERGRAADRGGGHDPLDPDPVESHALLSPHRGQAQAHLVDQQQPRARHQRAAEAEHLLLAAGEHPGQAAEALLQLGQHRDDVALGPAVLGPRQAQVLADGEVEEERAVLGDQRDALAGQPAGGPAADVGALEGDRPGQRLDQPGDRRERRRLAAPLGPRIATTSPAATVRFRSRTAGMPS
jgi:hypothetical protein